MKIDKRSREVVFPERSDELKFQRLVDKLPAAAYTCDADGLISYYNQHAVQIWGREPKLHDPIDRFCGSFRLFLPDGTPIRHDECWMALALKNRRQYDKCEILMERPDGTRRMLLAHANPVHDEHGRLIGAVNVLLDVTEEKRAEQKLRRSERELDDFFENATLGLHWVGPDGTILRANRAELNLLGYTAEEYVGHRVAEFHADEDVIADILLRLQNGEELHDYPARLRCKDGSIRHVIISSNVFWEDGRFTHTRCFTRDVTEQKRNEMRLAAEHAVTRILSDADSFVDAAPELLEAIRSSVDADICLLWTPDRKNTELCCVDIASRSGTDLTPFIHASHTVRFTKGFGLPGRVWETAEPQFVENINAETDFPRAVHGAECGLVSGIAFPMVSGKKFCGEIEFFTSRTLTRDQALLDMMAAIGSEIGLFIRRSALRDNLAEEQARKTAILNSVLDSIITMDIEGNIVDFNAAAERTFGYAQREVTGRLLVDTIIPDEYRDAHRKGLARYLKTGESDIIGKRLELSAVRADGSQFPIELSINVSQTADGQPFFTAYLRDITERKHDEFRREREAEIEHFMAEASTLLASSLDYETTLANVTQLCVPTMADWAFLDLVSDDGDVQRVKVAHADPSHIEVAAEVARFAATRTVMDHPPARALFGGKGLLITEFTEQILKNSAQSAEHEQVIRKVGPKSLVVVPLIARGITLGALTLIHATSGRRFESKDLAIAEDLGRRAAIAVDNARLHAGAQAANQTKSEFLANMSHELRTPMTAVLGYTDLLAARIRDPEEVKFLATIKRNGRFLLEIINDILDLSKIEAGKVELVRERFVVHQVVADIYSLMLVRAEEENLSFQVEYEGKVPATIHSDPTRLRQILLNLVGNAIKFTEEGSVRIRVRYLADANNPLLRFDVVDTGIGVDDHQRLRLFLPFSQGDASVTRNYGGTGLGLIISKRLATMLGGDITIDSERGKGSTFSVTISTGSMEGVKLIQPSIQADLPNLETQDDPKPIKLSCRVLIVDDRRDVRHLARYFLAECGADIEEAENGQEAIDLIQRRDTEASTFDIVLLDMQMPTLDGYQTAPRLREMGFDRPIIALTADAMRGDRERCLSAGCDDYLTKPIDRNELIDIVDRYLRNA